MVSRSQLLTTLAVAMGLAALSFGGCAWRGVVPVSSRPAAAPQGTLSDPVWQNQELNAERSDFVIHEHEFVVDSEFLNTGGEDHLKEIALRLASGQDSLVIVERSRTSARPDTEHKYPVHPNPDLDVRRREIVARSLMAMGIPCSDARVLIAPDLAPEYRAGEQAAAYYDDFGQRGNGWGGIGTWGGGGGWGGGW